MRKKGALDWIFKVPGKSLGYTVLLTVLQTVSGVLGISMALISRDLVDTAVAGQRDAFIRNALIMASVILLQIVIYMISTRVTEKTKATFENKFKHRLFDNILRKDFSRVSAVHSGEWINRLTNDTVVVSSGAVDIIPSLCGKAVRIICAAVMLILTDRRIALILVPCGIVLAAASYFLRKKLKALHKDVQSADGKLRIFYQESIGNLIMIRSFDSSEQTLSESDAKAGEHKDARMRRNTFSVIANTGFSLAMNGMYLAALFYGGYGILTGRISYGTLMAMTQLVGQIQGPLVNITGLLPRIFSVIASAERLMQIETCDDDISAPACDTAAIRSYYDGTLAAFGLKDACFTYSPAVGDIDSLSKDNMPEAIRNISIRIARGEYVAFKGYSGCGKSTVLKLFMGIFRPDSGSLYEETSSGETIPADPMLSKLFAYVPQGNFLMSGSIREVVCFSDKSSMNDDKRIDEALTIACAKEFTDTLEDGIDTMLGERGKGLSEGQMQRLAIARAVFSRRPVLLLDEATSALDADTESRLLQNLRDMTDMTVVIITHGEKALAICDRVIEFTESGAREVKKEG